MRLDKYLSETGFGTRSEVKKLIRGGSVTVNGIAASKPDLHIDELSDRVCIGGNEVKYRKFIYLMLNKPQGCVSATFDRHFPTVIDLVPEEYLHFEPFPVGRLDIDTEGLLILTNDGALSHRLLSPKSHVPKTYYAELDRPADENDIERFRRGIALDDFIAMPAELRLLDEGGTKTEVVIREGKFHQVKRMFEVCGKNVTYLKRIKMNNLPLDDGLRLGEIRELTPREIEMLTSTNPNIMKGADEND